jgi:hypothetical protein
MRMLLASLLLLALPAQAQQHRLIPADDPDVNAWIAQLQARGHLLELSPITRPYTEGAVRRAMEAVEGPLGEPERYWMRMLRQRLGEGTVEGKDVVGGTFEGGARLTTTQRADLLRPLSHDEVEGRRDAVLPVGDALFQTRGALDFFFERGPVFAQVGAEHDLAYEDDPDGLDVQRRSFIRSEDSYLHVAPFDGLSLLLGRTTRHWGAHGGPGLLVSDNPRSYDQIGFTLGGRFLTLTSLVGELDAIGSDGVFDGLVGDASTSRPGPDVGASQRFVAAHRLEYRPTPRLAISLEEAIVYSDPAAGSSLTFLNPLHPFILESDNKPKNEQHNLLLAGTLRWQPGLWTLQAQGMIDDFDLYRGLEPVAAALDLRVGRAAVTPIVDLRSGLTVVTRRAYNTSQTPGKYLYALRGLATNFSDYVHLETHADLHLMGGALRVTPNVHALWQGDGDPRDPWPLNPDRGGPGVLLDSLARRTLRGAVAVRYQPVAWAFAAADVGLNRSLTGTAFEGVVSFGVRLEERYWADLGLR